MKNSRLLIILVATMVLSLIVMAQPASKLTWLHIEVRLADDTLFSTSSFSPTLYLLPENKPNTRVDDGTLISNELGEMVYSDLTPGTHELSLMVLAYGIIDGPKTIEISQGANNFTWKLPPLYPVAGDMLLGGKPKAEILKLQCQLMAQGGNGRVFSVPILNTTNGYKLVGLPVGKYTALIYCERGYAVTEYDIPADGKISPPPPLPVLAAGRVLLQFVDKYNKPLPEFSTITLRREIAPNFIPVIKVTTDDNGAGAIDLPPGGWRWSAALTGFTASVGAVTVVGGEETELKIKLEKLPGN